LGDAKLAIGVAKAGVTGNRRCTSRERHWRCTRRGWKTSGSVGAISCSFLKLLESLKFLELQKLLELLINVRGLPRK
jgi:hypothetical protein